MRAIGKIQDRAAVTALSDYVDATPKNPPRQSREEAQKMVEARTRRCEVKRLGLLARVATWGVRSKTVFRLTSPR